MTSFKTGLNNLIFTLSLLSGLNAFSAFCAFNIISAFSARSAWASDHYLTPGQIVRLPDFADEPIKVKGRNVIAVQREDNQIHVRALAEGQASIQSASGLHKFYVLEKNQTDFLVALKGLLKNFMGLAAESRQGQIQITGTLHRLGDWQKIAELADHFNSTYLMRAKIDHDIIESTRDWILSVLRAKGLIDPPIEIHHGATIFLADEEQKSRTHWDRALKHLGVDIQADSTQISMAPLVRVRIVVAEVNKKLQSQLGIEWPDAITASVLPKIQGPSSLSVFLKAMEQNGLGQILASPNLLARSGTEADFLAGGEFAIKIITSRMREVVWKKHGIYLKIKPQADRSGRLNIELSTEVSLIDPSQSVDGVPGLKSNRMNTHFNLVQARTIVLSGLIRSDWGRSSNGIAGLSQIPLLGALLKSEQFHSNRSELVIFVTPEIVKSDDREPLMPPSWSEIK